MSKRRVRMPGRFAEDSKNNEKKKKTESARQHTSIEEAEELFRKSLTSHRQLESDLEYWKRKAKDLQAELDSLNGPEKTGKTTLTDTNSHYKPKRGTVVETCPYVFSESQDNVPRGFVQLVEGHDLYVDSKWIGTIKGLFRGKTKSHCFKLMMNGFYEPEDFLQKTAMLILQTPLGQALKGMIVLQINYLYSLFTFFILGNQNKISLKFAIFIRFSLSYH
ncbi:hypothetical protein FSP39_008327 [Pinctada imbricata]|uniref:Uncharacterized protein n=1 Tax=Pinctada imbricata TaxID=66713 RepID=A0AA88YRU2_PINIB|nr:hypothetical protein FSP39_008327 [Pinctada imbricata]